MASQSTRFDGTGMISAAVAVSAVLALFAAAPANAYVMGDQFTVDFSYTSPAGAHSPGAFTLGAETATTGVFSVSAFDAFLGQGSAIAEFFLPGDNLVFDGSDMSLHGNVFNNPLEQAAGHQISSGPGQPTLGDQLDLIGSHAWKTDDFAEPVDGSGFWSGTYVATPVPEPDLFTVMALGLLCVAGLGMAPRRQRRIAS